ncbi:hypothetical protein [Paucihalobacter sp.]|uniref:hypothetical protein n=1 Tax=Paucihalobacter sp. TaxID=2850405 RepID=UPI002FE2CA98
MTKVKIQSTYRKQLAALDASIETLNREKLKVLFAALGIAVSKDEFDELLGWRLIKVSVPERQMAIQLNKLSSYLPQLKFVIDPESELFTLRQGDYDRSTRKRR